MTIHFIEIDGASGGGQILRAALTLSSALGVGFHIRNIRGKREKPGLMRQHLMCVKACAEICQATVTGAQLNSSELTFMPGAVKRGNFSFDIGSGGSTVLLLQCIVPALARGLREGEEVGVTVKGGIYCPFAPTFEFLTETLAPCLHRMGYRVSFDMLKAGFYQAGGGLIRFWATGPFKPQAFEMNEAGRLLGTDVRILHCNLPATISEREKKFLIDEFAEKLGFAHQSIVVEEDKEILETGNAVTIRVQTESVISVFSEIGRPGLSAEAVARIAAEDASQFLHSKVPVCRHLQNQLLVPMALAGGGHFVSTSPTTHTRTCAQVLQVFTGKRVEIKQIDKLWEYSIPACE